jgi:hypothetical protein
MQRPAPVAQQDAGEPQAQEQEAQRECRVRTTNQNLTVVTRPASGGLLFSGAFTRFQPRGPTAFMNPESSARSDQGSAPGSR